MKFNLIFITGTKRNRSKRKEQKTPTFNLCYDLVTRTVTKEVDSSFCSKKEQQEFVLNEQERSHFGEYVTMPVCHQLAHIAANFLLLLQNCCHILSKSAWIELFRRASFVHPPFLSEKAVIICRYASLRRNEMFYVLNEGHYSKIIHEYLIDKPIVVTN